MNHTFTVFLPIVFAILLVLAIWSNSYVVYAVVYAEQLSSPSSLTPSSSASMPSSSQSAAAAAKIKITSPAKGQQVPVGKDLTISGTSIDNATASSADCKVSVIANKVRPYQPATAIGPGGVADYSKWNFILTSKYTTIKPGQNRITAKYECANNPALTAFYSVNVTGVQAVTQVGGIGSSITSAAALAPKTVNGTINQAQQTPAITTATPIAPQSLSSLSQLPKQTNSNENGIPIVLRPFPGGTCPQGYHLVSGAVCIKDLPSAAASTKTTPTTTIPTTTSTTKSFSVPSSPSTTSQHNGISSTNNNNNDNSNNEENFHTKILKSFNKEFK